MARCIYRIIKKAHVGKYDVTDIYSNGIVKTSQPQYPQDLNMIILKNAYGISESTSLRRCEVGGWFVALEKSWVDPTKSLTLAQLALLAGQHVEVCRVYANLACKYGLLKYGYIGSRLGYQLG